MARLEGFTAVVVGGHSGFGEAISRTFAGNGATVVVAGRRSDEVETAARTHDGIGVTCDITDDGQVRALVATALEQTGRLTHS